MNDNGIIVIFLLILIFLPFLIFEIIQKLMEDKAKEEVDEYLDEIDYLKIVHSNFKALFGDNNLHKRLQKSNQIVTNFENDKTYDYLVKYFGMVINDETLNHISNIYIVQKKAEEFVEGEPHRKNVLNKYTPSFTMYYSSPQGRSYSEVTYEFNTIGLKALYKQVKNLLTKQNYTKAQRSAMTNQIRESILRRDNWTCQRCGNSVYKEPNLLLEVDHIVPISKGGKTEPNNLQTLCWKCNRSKSDKIAIPRGDFEREQEVVFPDDNVF